MKFNRNVWILGLLLVAAWMLGMVLLMVPVLRLILPINKEPGIHASSQVTTSVAQPTAPDATGIPNSTPNSGSDNGQPNSTKSIQALPAQEFSFEVADSGAKAGLQTSLALDASGQPWIAYFDDGQDRVKLAAQHSDGWKYQDLKQAIDCSQYPSLKIDAHDQVHLSCASLKSGNVIYARLQPDQKWQVQEIQKNVVSGGTALVLDGQNRPHLIFIDRGQNKVFYASEANGWEVQEVGNGAEVVLADGMQAALAVDPSGQPHILFASTNQGLIYSSLKDGKWSSESVPTGGQAVSSPALAIRKDGQVFASFYDSTASALKLARSDGSHWSFTEVEKGGDAILSSLALDSHGRAHLSYYDAANLRLKYASEDDRGAWSAVIVNGSFGVGRYSSLVLDPQDHALISYYSDADQNLLFARQQDAAQVKAPELKALYRSGQTFITWPEREDRSAERYKVYRSSQPFGSGFPAGWKLLGEVGKNSTIFYANYYAGSDATKAWHPRFSKRLSIESGAQALPEGIGLFVWTLSPADFDGRANGPGYYAVTVTSSDGQEMLLAASPQPVQESVADPEPVEITKLPGVDQGEGGHVYIQYMDFQDWNPTFHAPNSTNNYFALDTRDPALASAVAYAYDYAVFEPTADQCGGKVPDVLPVYVNLHGWRGNRYTANSINSSPMCAYGIYPVDETETWYFGFAKYHDFRKGGTIQAEEGSQKEVIENYTEQRVLRMVYDLLKHPPRPDGPKPDKQRVYVFGFSMGGSGTLAFAQRYPEVFAAAYSGHPMTDYATAGVNPMDWGANVAEKWGSPSLNIPILSKAPGNWAARLQPYNGTGVWDWQNYQKVRFDDMVPLGVDLGVRDDVIRWDTQGAPFFPALDSMRQAWGGAATDQAHAWSDFQYLPVSIKKLKTPFWNLTVVKNESIPGLSQSSGNPAFPPGEGSLYYQTIKWSASWDPWDGAPLDTPDQWRISLCAVTVDNTTCGSGAEQTVDVTPRRLQKFKPLPNAQYDWENFDIANGQVIAHGTVTADTGGRLLIEKFRVLPSGNRLLIKKH